MRRTHLLGLALAAAASAALPAAATAAPRADRPAPPRFAIDVGTSESLQPAAPSGIIAILIGLRQYLRAGLIDDFEVHVAPVLLGAGERLFEDLEGGPKGYECVELVSSPLAAHYRFERK